MQARALYVSVAVAAVLAGCGGTPADGGAGRPPIGARASAKAADGSPTGTRASAKTADGSPTGHQVSVKTSGGSPTGTRKVDRITAIAQARYDQEVGGGSAHHELRLVARDASLLSALRRGDLAAARTEAARLQAGPGHISRIQVVEAGVKVVNVGVPFVVDGPRTRLTFPDGRALGVLTVSIQDEIGVVRLIHRNLPAAVVIRGARGEVRTSLPAATGMALPRTADAIDVGGARYDVRSFQRRAINGEVVTVWILTSG